jgi:hypothetical protein
MEMDKKKDVVVKNDRKYLWGNKNKKINNIF